MERFESCHDGFDNDQNGQSDLDDFGCFGPNQTEVTSSAVSGSALDQFGWTRLTRSADTRIIYVSSSAGSDTNSGLSPTAPVSTIGRGYSLLRQGYPDWLLLKRGDIFQSQGMGWDKSGRSTAEPMVWSSYGSGPRPELRHRGEGAAVSTLRGFGGPGDGEVSYLSIVGLSFVADQRLWFETPSGFSWRSRSRGILLEDNLIRGFGFNLEVQAYAGPIDNFALRRNIIANAFSRVSHSQGIYTFNVNDLLIEENILVDNGWRPQVVQLPITTGTYESDSRTLFQPGIAFAGVGTSYPQISAGDEIYISAGELTRGSVSQFIAAPSNQIIFRGDASLSSVDDFYTNRLLRFTTGENSTGSRAVQMRVLTYIGATREFIVDNYRTPYLAPAVNDQFRIDLIGAYPIEQIVDGNTIKLTAPGLAPYDLTAGDISTNTATGGTATIFNRTMYLNGGDGSTIVRGNIDANGASGGIQARRGGIVEGNLMLRSPVALAIGSPQNTPGTQSTGALRYNVQLGARDINNGGPRGWGIRLETYESNGACVNSVNGVRIEENILAHNQLGSGNLEAIGISNCAQATQITDNIVYNWTSPQGAGIGISILGSHINRAITRFERNEIQMNRSGTILTENSGAIPSDSFSFADNRYFSPLRSDRWFRIGAPYLSFSQWQADSRDADSQAVQVSYPDPDRTIERYQESLGRPATYDAFIQQALTLSKSSWDPKFTARAVINYVREGFGKEPMPP